MILKTLKLIKGNENLDENVFEFCLENCLNAEQILTDIFSLIFLQDKNNEYICDIKVAEKLLSMIIPLAKGITKYFEYFISSFKKLQKLNVFGSNKLKNLFSSPLISMYKALDNKDFELAKSFVSFDNKLIEICQTTQCIYMKLNNKKVPKTLKTKLYPIELYLSTNQKVKKEKEFVTNENVKILLKTERNLIIFEDFNEIIKEINQKFDDKNTKSLNIPRKYSLTNKIIKFYDLNVNNFETFLNNNNNIYNWELINNLFGENAIEKILINCDLTYASPELIKLISEKEPLIGKTIEILNNKNKKFNNFKSLKQFNDIIKDLTFDSDNKDEIFNEIINLIIEKCQITIELLFNFLDFADEIYLFNLSKNSIKILIENSMNLSKIPLNFLFELRIHCFDLFDDLFSEYFNKLSLYEMNYLYPEKYELNSSNYIQNNINSKTPNVIIDELISQNYILIAYKYSNEINLISYFYEKITEKIIFMIEDNQNFSHFLEENSFLHLNLINLPEKYQTNLVKQFFDKGKETKKDEIDIQSLIKQIKTTNDINIIQKISFDYFYLNNNEFKTEINNSLMNIINTLKVNSISSENNSIKTLKICKKITSKISFNNNKINWLLLFLQKQNHIRYQINYNLNDILELINICYKFDEIDLIIKVTEMLPEINVSNFISLICYNCFYLQQSDSALKYLEIQKNTNHKIENIDFLINILFHIIPSELLFLSDCFHVEIIPMFYRIICVIQGNTAKIDNSNYKLIPKIIKYFVGDLELIKFYCLYDSFNEVFDLLNEIKIEFNDFIKYIFEPLISAEHLSNFFKYIIRNNLNVSNNFVELFDFLEKNSLIFSLFEIYSIFGKNEDAILICSSMYSSLLSWKQKLFYYNQLKLLIDQEINERNKGKIPEKISDNSLSKLKTQTNLMTAFCEQCDRCDLNFDSKLDLFQSENSIKPMMFAMLFTRNFVLASKITELKPSYLGPVIEQIVETLYCSGKNAIPKYLIDLKKGNLSEYNYETISTLILINFEKKLKKRNELPKYILKYINGNDLQIKLLVKFGFLKDALKIAKSKQNIFMIKSAALNENNIQLAKECDKVITKYKN